MRHGDDSIASKPSISICAHSWRVPADTIDSSFRGPTGASLEVAAGQAAGVSNEALGGIDRVPEDGVALCLGEFAVPGGLPSTPAAAGHAPNGVTQYLAS